MNALDCTWRALRDLCAVAEPDWALPRHPLPCNYECDFKKYAIILIRPVWATTTRSISQKTVT